RDQVYSAPWVIRYGEVPDSTGSLVGFADGGERVSTIRSFDDVLVSMDAPARVGAELQIFRIPQEIESVGRVAVPTGVLTVSAIVEGGVVGVVTKEYDRIQPGDLVRPVPTYTLEPGVYPQEIAGGSEAMIMGFAGRQEINDLGHVAFLDLGSDDGITVGDEFVLYGDLVSSPRGTLQVVGVTRSMASARIVSMVDDVFEQGIVVRLSRKMP
ncbi:MAG TPA: hypothetical protein VFQ22_09780, partial [Longimicrobiales bacterium]|nr:hypothetical protein [Longimicrobiales bacterium]